MFISHRFSYLLLALNVFYYVIFLAKLSLVLFFLSLLLCHLDLRSLLTLLSFCIYSFLQHWNTYTIVLLK